MCLARTDWDVPKHRGLTWFAVPTDARRAHVRPIPQINGDAGFCEEFLDDVSRHRRRPHRRSQPGLVGRPDDARVRAGRRASRARRRSSRAELAPDLVALARRRRSRSRPRRPAAHRSGPHQRLRPVPPRAADRGAAAVRGHARPRRRRLRQAGGGHVRTDPRPPRARDRRRRGAGMGAGDDAEAHRPAINYLNGRMVRSPPGRTRCSATASASGCSDLPREPSFDSNKPFSEVVRSARNWSGRSD